MTKLTVLLGLFLYIELINCNVYDVNKYFYDGVEFSLNIPINHDINDGWSLELQFDDEIHIDVYGNAMIKSKKDDKIFQFTNTANSKQLKGSSTLKIRFQGRFVGAGANLIKAVFNGKTLDIGPVPHHIPATVEPIGPKGHYDYGKVLHASLLFYEAQRSGKLPSNNRITWRHDSMLNDKGDNGEDLTGGYFDAGDLVKFGFPMAYTATVLAWGAIDYEDSYKASGELQNMRDALKWFTDYFIKCHTKEREFYGQIGNGGEDHAVWGRPEDWPKEKKRPAYKISSSGHGSDLLGETAAALAAAAIAFKEINKTYSEVLIKHSISLYEWANDSRGTYTDSIPDAAGYYRSFSGYGDELGWSSAWIYRATKDKKYFDDFKKHWIEFKLDRKPQQFSWDDKTPGVQTLIAQITGEDIYKSTVKTYCDWIVNDAKKTPKGMVYLDQWGPLRHAANAAFICLKAADMGINTKQYREFAMKQIGYILGDTGRSFVVGVGVNPPQRPHHRGSSCADPPLPCNYHEMQNPGPNPQILTGALVGGPDQNDAYQDKRDDFVHNEVACDYNAGFQSAVAALAHLHNM